jgi:hypothetical protein
VPSRRKFIGSAMLYGALAGSASIGSFDQLLGSAPSTREADISGGDIIRRIKSLRRRDETILRYGGNGDVFPMTWSADDRQLGSLLDGTGWSPDSPGQYNSRVFMIEGEARAAKFLDLSSYPSLLPTGKDPRYYGFGLLEIDYSIYHFLCALAPSDEGWKWVGTKIIYSPDGGKTWLNQDGSAPVRWEHYGARSRGTLLFYDEPDQIYSLLSVLQMGRSYGANKDGFAYVYSPNGFIDGLMNQLILARVPKDKMLHRTAYEFFAGPHSDGSPAWTSNVDKRAAVHTFPRGWVNRLTPDATMVAQSWVPSVTYNEPLGLYMMANWGNGCAPDGSWFGKPSYLGFWVSRNPWGPWTQIHEEFAWTPGRDTAARCYSPQISPKWISSDGRSFWLVWTDYQGYDQWIGQWKREGIPFDTRNPGDLQRMYALMRRVMPYYAFNTQRVDLDIA